MTVEKMAKWSEEIDTNPFKRTSKDLVGVACAVTIILVIFGLLEKVLDFAG